MPKEYVVSYLILAMIYPESFPCHVLEYDEVMLWLLIVVLVHKIKWLGFLAGGLPVHFLSAGRRY